jgi:hypothetical protein
MSLLKVSYFSRDFHKMFVSAFPQFRFWKSHNFLLAAIAIKKPCFPLLKIHIGNQLKIFTLSTESCVSISNVLMLSTSFRKCDPVGFS